MYSFLRKGLIALALFCCSGMLLAQYALPADELAKVPVKQLPTQNNSTLLTAEMEARAPGRANRFAVPIPTKIRPSTHGMWSENGANSIWRMRINSPEAETLNLGFSEYNLPEGAELYLITAEERLGPFTIADNEEHNQLWTPVMDGDELMLELHVPTAHKNQVQLYLTFVNHDFINLREIEKNMECNLDVICGQADGWGIVDGYRDIIRSVAAYTINGSNICTGFLVNNINEDGRPLFMTANHCNVTPSRAPALVAYWNYENSNCREVVNGTLNTSSGSNGRRNVFNSGATHLASYAPSDVTIIEFDDPINPAANAFFAGWSAEAEVPTDTMIAIHHPGVREKRISFSFRDPYRAGYYDAPDPEADHLEIPQWDIGTTEGGSSGSPVFDRFKRVRGQLHGGNARCDRPTEFDSYGYFHTSWEGGGTSTSRLRDHLDPCGTGTLTIDGLEYSKLSTILLAESNCTNSCSDMDVSLPFVLADGFPAGTAIDIVSSTAGISPVLSTATAAGGETVVLTIPADAGVTTGFYTVVVSATGGAAFDEITLTFGLSASTSTIAQVNPAEGAVSSLPRIRFDWDAASLAIGYDFEISTSSDFSTILEAISTTTETEAILTDALASNVQYYWRVRSYNECGPGEWSTASFTTADFVCNAIDGSNLPVAISTGDASEVLVELEVDNAFPVNYFEVNLDISHTYVGDLQARLRSPEGTEIQLFNRIRGGGCEGENISVQFIDATSQTSQDFTTTCTDGAISTQGVFQPVESFAAFTGESAEGTWTLVLNDEANQDGGEVTAFSLSFCNVGVFEDLSVRSSVNALTSCQNDPATVVLTLGSDFADNVTLSVSADDEELSNYTSAFNSIDRLLTVDFTDWSSLALGDYTLTFTVTNDDGTERTASISLRVETAVTESVLASPEDNIQIQEGEVTFNWDASTGATSYVLQYSATEDFAVISFEQTTTGTLLSLNDLPIGDPIFWRVISRNDCGEAISDVRELRIIPAGTHDFGAGRVLNVFPNPVKGLLTVDASGNWPGGLNATLFDATGRLLAKYSMDNAGRTQWNLGEIPAGIYYLRFNSQGREQTERLVVLP